MARQGLVDALARDGRAVLAVLDGLLAVLDGRETTEVVARAGALLATVTDCNGLRGR